MDKQSRALRRHHRDRMYRRLYKRMVATWSRALYSEEDLAYLVSRRRDNAAACSCYMCGNPRHAFGHKEVTLQEQKAYQSFEDQLVDLEP